VGIQRILLVDDDRALAGVVSAALTEEGYAVTLATAFLYEKSLIRQDEDRLTRVVDEAATTDPASWPALAKKDQAWLRRIAIDGTIGVRDRPMPVLLKKP